MAQAQTKQHKPRSGTSRQSSSQQRSALPPVDLENLANINGRNLEIAMRMGQAMFDGVATMNQEFLKFISTRLEEDMKNARSLADCRHPTDFVDTELKFLQTLVEHYAQNANTMLGIAANVMRHGVHDVEEVVSEVAPLGEDRAA